MQNSVQEMQICDPANWRFDSASNNERSSDLLVMSRNRVRGLEATDKNRVNGIIRLPNFQNPSNTARGAKKTEHNPTAGLWPQTYSCLTLRLHLCTHITVLSHAHK